MSEATTFPRVQQLQIGYAPLEDRILLRLTLVSEGGCNAWVPRAVAGPLVERLNAALKRSHPAAETAPADDTVMALEHIAARSQLAGAADAVSDDLAEASRTAQAAGPVTPWTTHLVSEARVEAGDEGGLRIGLLGHRLTAEGLARGEAEAVAGLMLERAQAHELLRMVTEQAEQAGWALEGLRVWPRWLARKI